MTWQRWLPLALLVAIALLAALALVLLARRQGKRPTPSGLGFIILGAAPALLCAIEHARASAPIGVRFASPIWLALGVPIGLLLAVRLPALRERMAHGRRVLVTATIAVGLFAATLAVGEPEIGRAVDRVTVVVAVDRSRSMELASEKSVAAAIDRAGAERDMRGGDRLGVVAFASDARTEDPPRARHTPALSARVTVAPDGTDFEAAIRRALSDIPPDSPGRVVVVTDGAETRGDTRAAATLAAARGIPIDVILLDRTSVNDVRVEKLRAPARADDSEPLDFGVVVNSSTATDVDVELSRDGEPIRKTHARIKAGEDVIRLRELAPGAGLHRYDVHVTATTPGADAVHGDNDASAYVQVRGPTTALVIDGDGRTLPLAKALEATGFAVEQRGAGGVPSDIDGLAPYDLVVVGDVAASGLLPTQLSALAGYARDLGGGLLLMGGDRSLGPGGFARTPVEEVSPVAFDLKQDGRRANLSEVIIIDYSGSMGAMVGTKSKLDLANEAAVRSAALLGAEDRVGVMHVDTEILWSVPMSRASDRSIERRIRSVGVGGGGIYTDISLRGAYAALEREHSGLKHVLLFADGDDAEQIAGCRAIVAAAHAKGVTTSVISLGTGTDTPELEALSKAGVGRFYLIDDAQKLPAVFAQETVLASRSAVHEKPFVPSAGVPSPATRGVDVRTAPPLRGWVTTEAKPRASVLLGAPEGDPLLATWSVGIGRVSVFTSDFKDRWGAAWLSWPGGAQLFSQLARETARKPRNPRVHVAAETRAGNVHVTVDAPALGFQTLSARVRGPLGFAEDAPLLATALGRYEATIRTPAHGAYAIAIVDTLTSAVVDTTGAVSSASAEMRQDTSGARGLRDAAAATGGVTRRSIAGIFADRPPARFAYAPAAWPLLVLALIALLTSVAARRLAVPAWIARLADRRRAARASVPEGRVGLARSARRRPARRPSAPRAGDGPDLTVAPAALPPPVAPTAPSAIAIPLAVTGGGPPPPSRGRSTAERLAARRRADRA